MSKVEITKITGATGTELPNFTNGFNIAGADSGISGFTHHTNTDSDGDPTSPANGDTWWNSDTNTYKVYANGAWQTLIGTSSSSATFAWGGDRAVTAGGFLTDEVDTIDYFDITTPGNATDFGNLAQTSAWNGNGTVSNTTRGVFMGGAISTSNNGPSNFIQYVTFATPGNATDFGDMNVKRSRMGQCSDSTRGVAFAGQPNASDVINDPNYPYANNISAVPDTQYITIATTGNSSTFGNLFHSASWQLTACSDGTYGVCSRQGVDLEYITIQTTGDAQDFGDLLQGLNTGSSCSDTTRGVFGGATNSNDYTMLHYITIASPGNATDFGDLSPRQTNNSSTSNGTTGVWCGGYGGSNKTNQIHKITIQTTGNSTDFGDLTQARQSSTSSSGAAS